MAVKHGRTFIDEASGVVSSDSFINYSFTSFLLGRKLVTLHSLFSKGDYMEMNSITEDNKIPEINVEKIIYSKNKRLAKIIPPFVLNYLKKIVHQEELNGFLKEWGHLENAELIGASLKFMSTRYTVFGEENIPVVGRNIFVSNHPLGGLDGLVFIYELSKYFKDIKFPVNDILMSIGHVSGIFLPVNKHGFQDREAVRKMEQAFESESQILYFPAGLCSRKRRGVVRDLKWHKSFISKAIQYRRNVIPVHISGRNSNFFYSLSNFRKFLGIKANIEMLYLPDEMFRQKDKEIHLVFGKSIPWQTFDKTKSPAEWAEWVKSKSYELQFNPEVKM
jgi:1-acyl-sn-glycerol-3-phosphate acyltransferase